jgi:hypothetical protein
MTGNTKVDSTTVLNMHCVTHLCTSLGALYHSDFPYLSGKSFIHNSEEMNCVIGKYMRYPVTKNMQFCFQANLPKKNTLLQVIKFIAKFIQ